MTYHHIPGGIAAVCSTETLAKGAQGRGGTGTPSFGRTKSGGPGAAEAKGGGATNFRCDIPPHTAPLHHIPGGIAAGCSTETGATGATGRAGTGTPPFGRTNSGGAFAVGAKAGWPANGRCDIPSNTCVGTDKPRGCAAVRCAVNLAAAQKSCQLVCTSAAAEPGGTGAAKTKSGTGFSDIPPNTAHLPACSAAGSGSGFRLTQFLVPLPFVFILETGGCGPATGAGGTGHRISDIPHTTCLHANGGGSEPRRAGPGRAVAQVGAGDAGADVGGKVKRGRTVAQCAAEGAIFGVPDAMFAINTDSCPERTATGGGATAAAALAARLAAFSAKYLSSRESGQGSEKRGMLQTGLVGHLQGEPSPSQRHVACAWEWDTPPGSTRQRRTRAALRQRAGLYGKHTKGLPHRRRRSCWLLGRSNGRRRSPRRPVVEIGDRTVPEPASAVWAERV